MKPTKKQIMFFMALLIVLATVSIFSLIRRSETASQQVRHNKTTSEQVSHNRQAIPESSAPIATEESIPEQAQPAEVPVLSEVEGPEPTQISNPAAELVEVTRSPIITSLPAPKPAVSAETMTFIPTESKSATESLTGEIEHLRTDISPHHGIIGYNRRAVPEHLRNPAIPNAAEYNRHREMYTVIRPYLQSPTSNYSEQQIEQLNAALAEKLPEKYGKMLMELQDLKEQEIINRQLAERRIQGSPPDVNEQ